MFVVKITYKKPLELIEQHLNAHRAFLDRCYQENFFIASGPQKPRVGGIILTQLRSREQLLDLLKNDPFLVHELADYEVIEFEPVKFHENFAGFI